MVLDVRSWLGEQVRTRVVGPDAPVRHAELFDTDEPGWFADDAPIRRVAQAEVPLPYNRRLEQMALPQVADVVSAVKDVMYLK